MPPRSVALPEPPRTHRRATAAAAKRGPLAPAEDFLEKFQPPQSVKRRGSHDHAKARAAGEELLMASQVALVLVAGGQQCAPRAHETLGTAPDGVVRISAGPANDEADLGAALDVIARL